MSIRQQLKMRSPFAQWLILGTALLLLGCGIGWKLYAEYNNIDALERERLAHQAKVIEENLDYQLLATDQALDAIRNDLRPLKARGQELLNRRLKAMSDAMPGVRTLLILDAEGNVSASNREELIGHNFREREYFQAARRSRSPALLRVSPPFKTVLGVFAMNIGKVILDDRGEFAGVVSATLDPGYFSILLDSVRYAPDMWTSLAHADGKLFLMMPARPGIEGIDLDQPGSFRNRHLDTGQDATVMTGIVSATGEERMMAQRIIKPANVPMDKPLVVAVARDLKIIFSPWRKDAYELGGTFVMLVLGTSLGLFFYQRRRLHFDRLTAIHEAEQRRNAEQYQTIIQSSFDGFWITDSHGRIVDANESSCRMLGYSREELLRMGVQDIVADESPEEIAARTREIAETGRSRFEARHRCKDGKLIDVEVSAQYVAALGERFFVFVRDITERKTAEAELKRSNAELEQFSYAISHDMRQPLRMISSYMQLLETELAGQLDGEKREYFDFARDGAKRLDRMLVALLEYSRVGRLGEPPAWIESRAVLDEALLFLQPAVAEAQAAVRIQGDWPRIFVSPDEMLRLMQNLIGNAIKFRVAGRTPEIGVTSEVVGSEWRLNVTDNGVGILPDQIGRLFQVFQRLQSRADYEGTGIGLALCRKIAEHHHGRIWAESKGAGQGSTFCLALPLKSPLKPV